MQARRRLLARCAPLVLSATLVPACASLEFRRSTQTSGTFRSSGWAVTLISVDIPKTAEQIARENASDSKLANLQITDIFLVPYLGPFDWLLDIFSIRYCRIDGTWGFPGPEGTAPDAKSGSSPGS
jgi:hypothetical protein